MIDPKTKLPTPSGTSVRMKIHATPRWVFEYSDSSAFDEKNQRIRRYCHTSRVRATNPWSTSGAMIHPPSPGPRCARTPGSDGRLALLPGIDMALYRPVELRGDRAALQLGTGLVPVGDERQRIVENDFRFLAKVRVYRDVHGVGRLGQQVRGDAHHQIDDAAAIGNELFGLVGAKDQEPLGVDVEESAQRRA